MSAAKFSVLLPTRDRLELAKGAIETVRRQTYQNWELVVADNCSKDDVAGYVRGLGDPRIVYTRSDVSLPVTENWNRALERSSGDYVVMLGDDDALTPGYFEDVLQIMARLEQPDFLYAGAYHFAFPGAMPNYPQGALTDVTLYQSILQNRSEPGLMRASEADESARAALNMWALYGFNMQYFVFSRRFLDRMAVFGRFFQGPFPDFYAANMSLLQADKIGLAPKPLVIIGISPKSYGYFHFNKKEGGGVALLTAGRDDDIPPALRARMLPGTNMLNSWLVSVDLIPRKLPDRSDLKLGIGRYRLLQIIHNLRAQAAGEPAEATLAELWPRLSWGERLIAAGLWAALWPARFLPGRWRSRCLAMPNVLVRQHLALPPGLPPPIVGRFQSMVEVFEHLENTRGSSAAVGSQAVR